MEVAGIKWKREKHFADLTVQRQQRDFFVFLVEAHGADLLCTADVFDADGRDVRVGWTRLGFLFLLLLGEVDDVFVDAPQGEFRVARARNKELVVQPAHVEHPVAVSVLADADGVEGGKSVDCDVRRVSSASRQQRPTRVDLTRVDAGLCIGVSTAGVAQRWNRIYAPHVHIVHHQLVALCAEHDLPVAQPL